MRRAMLLVMVLIVAGVTSAQWASACGFASGFYWGRCGAPCGYAYYCSPCYRYVPCYTVCEPVACEPACCEPAAPVQTIPLQQPPVQQPPVQQPPATNETVPTLAPPQPPEQPAAAPPTAETKSPAATQPAKQPGDATPPRLDLPAELPLPSSPSAGRAAEEGRMPSKSPVLPAGPKARPVEQPLDTPDEKPLVATISGDPFVVETDQLQIWTDATGNYRVEARFISFDDHTVRLQRANGQYVRVEYDRLSIADRQRVQDLSLVLAMKTSMK